MCSRLQCLKVKMATGRNVIQVKVIGLLTVVTSTWGGGGKDEKGESVGRGQ